MNSIRVSRRVVLLCALVLMLVLTATIAGQTMDETPIARWEPEGRAMLPLAPGFEGVGTALDQPSPAAPESLVPNSAMAFQGFVDGNWEIFYYTDQLPGNRRLTAHGAADIRPSLNRGSNLIAFASNRDGDFEIYVVDHMGGNLRQLTFNNSDDVEPTWSPDGQMIAFESYRDGNPEIYVMNADGSGQRRLTASAGFDGMPAWSPDGARIAFSSDRSGGYRIMLMDSDGGNVQGISSVPSSFRPVWSPDGSRLLFDADFDDDGWLDLYIINVDGSGEELIFDPSPPFEAYAAGWSPDGREVAFVESFWVYVQGNWYIQRAQIFQRALSGGATMNAVAGEANLYAHWETVDALPPQTTVAPLPPLMPVDGFHLQWSGEDLGPVGLRSYDIEYRQGSSGEWQEFLYDTTETLAPFDAVSGETMDFRSRGSDRHYNVESWPLRPDSYTRFYEWSFAGQAVDNRGAPVSGVPLASGPNLLWPVVSEDDGVFQGYATITTAYGLSAQAPGYGPLPMILADPLQRYAYPFYLPPADNVVDNGDFEQAPGTLQAWTVTGDLPAAVDEEASASGAAALSLGSDCAAPPCLGAASTITGTTSEYGMLATTTDSDGALHVLWRRHDEASGQIRIMHGWRAADGTWSAPLIIASFPVSSWAISGGLVSDSEGNLHAVWHDTQGLRGASRAAQGSWTQPRVLRNLPLGYANNMLLGLLITGDDRLQLLYVEDYKIYHMERDQQGTWNRPQMLWEPANQSLAAAAVGPDNRLHVVAVILNTVGDNVVAHRWRNPEGLWSNDEIVFLPNYTSYGTPELLIDAHNNMHLFIQDWALHHYVRHPGEGWFYWQEIQDAIQTEWALETDSRGQVHMIYREGSDTKYRLFRPFSGWQAPINVPQPYHNVVLEVDSFDNVHALFEDFPDERWYRGMAAAGSEGEVSISQQVTVPVQMDAPTLAFMARAVGDRPGDGTMLKATVGDGVQPPTEYSWDIDAGWQTYWADVGEWSGATISVTFTLQQRADDPALRVWLDDVSLGSAHPNLFVDISGATDAAPGGEAEYVIRFGNAGGVDAGDASLVVTLPAGVAFVSASVPPASTTPLTWELGTLSAGQVDQIDLTLAAEAGVAPSTTVAWQAAVTSSSAEAWTTDNEDETELFVGYRVLLPAIRRE